MDRVRNLTLSLFLIGMTFRNAIPVLAGILALFLLRDRDRSLTWGGR